MQRLMPILVGLLIVLAAAGAALTVWKRMPEDNTNG